MPPSVLNTNKTVRASEETFRTVVFDTLVCTRDTCLLGEPTRRRLFRPGHTPPRPDSPRPARGTYVWFLKSASFAKIVGIQCVNYISGVTCLYCLSCDNIPRARDCSYVKKCGPHEVSLLNVLTHTLINVLTHTIIKVLTHTIINVLTHTIIKVLQT